MGLEDFKEGEPDISEGTTVRQLIDLYGEEAVRRGLNYIHNLSDANESYKQSAKSDNLREGYEDTFGEDGDYDDAVSEWEKGMENKGLGVSDE